MFWLLPRQSLIYIRNAVFLIFLTKTTIIMCIIILIIKTAVTICSNTGLPLL